VGAVEDCITQLISADCDYNQSGVARGYFPESALVTVEEESASYWKWVSNLLGSTTAPPPGCGSELRDRFSFRKPEPGL